MKAFCDCGQTCTIKTLAQLCEFVDTHGHVPMKVTIVCACGERRDTGPQALLEHHIPLAFARKPLAEYIDPFQDWLNADTAWMEKHRAHGEIQ